MSTVIENQVKHRPLKICIPSFLPSTHPFLCVCACVHMPWFLYRVQKTTCQSWFSPFIMWYPGLNTGHQTWREMSLTTEPFCWLRLSFLKSSLTCCFRHRDQALVWWGPWGSSLYVSVHLPLILSHMLSARFTCVLKSTGSSLMPINKQVSLPLYKNSRQNYWRNSSVNQAQWGISVIPALRSLRQKITTGSRQARTTQ